MTVRPGAEAIGSCECWELNSRLLPEQYMLLNAGQSLWPKSTLFLKLTGYWIYIILSLGFYAIPHCQYFMTTQIFTVHILLFFSRTEKVLLLKVWLKN